jgi:DNA repair ATPase RecN
MLHCNMLQWQLSRKHGVTPAKLGTAHTDLREELDGLAEAAEALPRAQEAVAMWREEV